MFYKHVLRIGMLLLIVFSLSACEELDELMGKDDDNPYAVLNGEWHGSRIDTVSGLTYHRYMSVFMDGAGKITKININGSSTGLTGSTASMGSNLFKFVLTDGTEGGVLLSSGGKHMGFVDGGSYNYGVLQKGVLQTVTYSDPDIVGAWSGSSVLLNNAADVIERNTNSATVLSDYSFTSTASDGVNTWGTFTYIARNYWTGTGGDSEGNYGNVLAMMSTDKNFMFAWACTNSYSNTFQIFGLGGCSFSIWDRK